MSDGKERPWTPGPWQRDAYDDVQALDGSGHVARITGSPIVARRRANAALIAAAPDLYEALDAMLAHFPWLNGDGQEWPVVTKARAALSRANPQGEEK